MAFEGMAASELRAAKEIAASADLVEHRIVRLPDLKEAQDIGRRFGDLPPTYIPMRNAVFYSLAASFAEETEAGYLVGGHNKDDMRIFQDTAPAFFGELEAAFRAGSRSLRERRLRILRPLQSKTKAQVVKLAYSLGVPLELTWSCLSDGETHCWKCEGCASRVRAFQAAGITDPLRRIGEKIS